MPVWAITISLPLPDQRAAERCLNVALVDCGGDRTGSVLKTSVTEYDQFITSLQQECLWSPTKIKRAHAFQSLRRHGQELNLTVEVRIHQNQQFQVWYFSRFQLNRNILISIQSYKLRKASINGKTNQVSSKASHS